MAQTFAEKRKMQFNALVDPKVRNDSECAVIGIYENGDLGAAARQVDAQLGGRLQTLCRNGDFAGKLGDTLLLLEIPGFASARLLLVGLGSRTGFGRKQYRKAVQASATALSKSGAGDAAVYLPFEPVADLDIHYRCRIIAELFSSQAYKVPDLKTPAKPKPARLTKVQTALPDSRAPKHAATGIAAGNALGNGMAFARDLANLPPNVCTPRYIASRAQALAKDFPSITTKIHDEEAIKSF